MSTSCPLCTSSRAPAGVSATRYSSVLISLATPIRKTGGTLACRREATEVHEQAYERLRVLDLAEPRLRLVDAPALDRDHLVLVRLGLAFLDALREKDVHALATE